MKASELKQMSTEELQGALASETSKLRSLRFSHAVAPIENPTRLKLSRKDIARIKTELHARTIASVEEKVASGELTFENAREFCQKVNLTLPSPITLAKIKKIIGRTAK